MKKLISLALLVFAFNATFAVAHISNQEFSDLIKNSKDLVIIDANRTANYATSHVKNAVNVWQQEIFLTSTPEGKLKSNEELAKYFGDKGISETSNIVIYDDGTNKYTTRIWFVLKYLGVVNVKIVTKIDAEWAKFRIPVNATAVKLPAVKFNVTPNPSMQSDFENMKAKMGQPGFVLVDVRYVEEFNGADKDKKSEGHLPGAKLIPHKELLKADGSFKSKEEIAEIAKKYDLSPDKEIVFYCYSGVRAAVNYYVFKEIMEYPHVTVLDGGYNYWALDKSNKIDK
jgi:thiosulfate/3-mercaptopyruvate sulfurtransferase